MMYLALTESGAPIGVFDTFIGAMVGLGDITLTWGIESPIHIGVRAECAIDNDGNRRGYVIEVELNPDNSVGKRGVW